MSQSSSPQQIPVVVLAGFLGSGKTTLLNHLLHHSGGSRIGAIVNDFGAIEIDAMAVAGALGDSTVSLGNGCLCCAVDASELDLYLDRLAQPSAGIDVIVIEASGLAEPQELVRMVLASEQPRVVYGGLVEVVDAVEFDATRAKHPELDRHLALADLVVVNKTDRAGDTERVLRLVGSLTDGAAVVPAVHGRIDPEFLFDCRPAEERIGQLSFDDLHRHDGPDGHGRDGHGRDGHGPDEHGPDGRGADGHGPDGRGADGCESVGCGSDGHRSDGHRSHGCDGHGHGSSHVHLHAGYDSLSFRSTVPMNPRRLLEFLDGRPEGLYRIKGYVDFGAADPRNRYAVHAVGRFLRFYPEAWKADEQRLTQLVLIGSGIDTAALRKELEACADDAPHTDEHSMWGVLRYVQDKETEVPAGLGDPEG
ncbi:GTP-binding protein [Streptomyces sp. TP-A0356]|uniref:CobW family GTP-binding protein n=1 Tax=Streptomyces sp. TP-A0356 TaxID=1359208 RepID=UPI0006E18BE2|nr:CobW family GTP-binding protein [Streptomyces sp. TP-A0356]